MDIYSEIKISFDLDSAIRETECCFITLSDSGEYETLCDFIRESNLQSVSLYISKETGEVFPTGVCIQNTSCSQNEFIELMRRSCKTQNSYLITLPRPRRAVRFNRPCNVVGLYKGYMGISDITAETVEFYFSEPELSDYVFGGYQCCFVVPNKESIQDFQKELAMSGLTCLQSDLTELDTMNQSKALCVINNRYTGMDFMSLIKRWTERFNCTETLTMFLKEKPGNRSPFILHDISMNIYRNSEAVAVPSECVSTNAIYCWLSELYNSELGISQFRHLIKTDGAPVNSFMRAMHAVKDYKALCEKLRDS